MRLVIGFIVILATASVARAQPDSEEPPRPHVAAPEVQEERGFVGGGMGLGADIFLNGSFVLEGARKIPHQPLWVRGSAAAGGSLDVEGSGHYLRGLVGLETRACRSSGGVCGFVDLDAGFQGQTWHGNEPEDDEVHHGFVGGPAIGFDAGDEHVRYRFALELHGYRDDDRAMSTLRDDWVFAPGFTMTVAYRL